MKWYRPFEIDMELMTDDEGDCPEEDKDYYCCAANFSVDEPDCTACHYYEEKEEE